MCRSNATVDVAVPTDVGALQHRTLLMVESAVCVKICGKGGLFALLMLALLLRTCVAIERALVVKSAGPSLHLSRKLNADVAKAESVGAVGLAQPTFNTGVPDIYPTALRVVMRWRPCV